MNIFSVNFYLRHFKKDKIDTKLVCIYIYIYGKYRKGANTENSEKNFC